MYPPRSRRKENNKHSGRRRPRTAWAWINAVLLLMITALLSYYFIEGNKGGGPGPPPSALSHISPSPEAGTGPGLPDVPPASVPPEASLEPEGSSEPTPSVPPEQEAGPEASQTPAAGVQPGSGLSSGDMDAGNTVKMSFGGDVIFAGKVGELLMKKGYDYPYAFLDGMFTRDDLTVVNLETPVTERGTAANKRFVFKSAPQALDAMKAAGVDAVNLANNHSLDQGVQGLEDTFSHLETRGIPYVGAGLNEEAAYTAQYFERNGMTIALLGFTRVMPEHSWRAGKDRPGVASVYDSKEGLQAIAEADKKADIVVVVVHWGRERESAADDNQQSLGRSFIDAGADLVIGGHPHVLQGIEPYKGKWIAYSTGNFIFTRSTVPATWETAVFQAECNSSGQCSLQLQPFDAELGQPVPMNAEDGQKLLAKVEALSGGQIRIGSDGKVIDSRNSTE